MADTMRSSIQWCLTDEGMGFLERAGLAGLYLSLTSADQRRAEGDQNAEKLAQVLTWELTDTSVRLEWNGDDLSVMSELTEWAWQVRDGVYYLPGIHRNKDTRDNWFMRVQTHSGLLGTFIKNDQLKVKVEEPTSVPIQFDADNPAQTISIRYRPIKDGQETIQLKTLRSKKICPFRDKKDRIRAVSLPGWASPGAAKRFGESEEDWTGRADQAFLLLFAPIACFYINLPRTKSKKIMRDNWAFITPEITSFTRFAEKSESIQSKFQCRFDDLRVSGLGDAGLRFAVLYSGTVSLRYIKTPIINLTSMGVTDYYSSSPKVTSRIRTRVLKLHPSNDALIRYSKMIGHMNNSMVQIRLTENSADGDETKATHWLRRPTARGRIADNLVRNEYWYKDLTLPPSWQLDELEKQRERQTDGISNERLWFRNLQREREELMNLAEEEVMWDSVEEKALLSVFHGALRRLLNKEEDAASRGGSRTLIERWDRRTEATRRELVHAKTLPLAREFMAEFLAEAGWGKDLVSNRAALWSLINHPQDWKKARELTLLALVTFTDRRLARADSTTKEESQ